MGDTFDIEVVAPTGVFGVGWGGSFSEERGVVAAPFKRPLFSEGKEMLLEESSAALLFREGKEIL